MIFVPTGVFDVLVWQCFALGVLCGQTRRRSYCGPGNRSICKLHHACTGCQCALTTTLGIGRGMVMMIDLFHIVADLACRPDAISGVFALDCCHGVRCTCKQLQTSWRVEKHFWPSSVAHLARLLGPVRHSNASSGESVCDKCGICCYDGPAVSLLTMFTRFSCSYNTCHEVTAML